ncbi:response regulator transcription factor [Eubacterium oxidoreducens]|uniref:LuxR family transcriptional regulator, maltose regulon positive regulatory protein n=1 Tax=Eubacterium oxidoreducens TaxID=1732 RepID=A0A1G6CFK9_EUBOX|nr:LuxR family transcriptional regulator [Eubacterium oxidoreducens]SDB31601.1 LuxR family transcriptional regulator, maltose regulon positive regulatory protein [Eubacterium oxidoreducens]
MGYIKVPKVYEKLKKAEELYLPVFISAATCWGKSAAVEYYYRRKATRILRCINGAINEMPTVGKIRENIVVIEDMQWLSQEESVQYLRKLLYTEGLQVIMISRGILPSAFALDDIELGFVRIFEKDFAFEETQVSEYFEDKGILLTPEQIAKITKFSKGYVCALHCYATRIIAGEKISESLNANVVRDIYHMWDARLVKQWSEEFWHFALCVCVFERFHQEMAEYITGNKNVSAIIEYCREKMNQLWIDDDGNYYFRPEIRGYYLWKRDLLWTKELIEQNNRMAAEYYEKMQDVPNALKYYSKAHATKKIREILVRNAQNHPGVGHYVDTKEYYFQLPEEDIAQVPVLMAGMSMLYALMLMPEKSEEWYAKLENFENDKANSRELRKEARTRLAYLDIALPHRGTKGILRIMRDVFNLITKGDVVLPEFSVTGNMPSLMNGGLDFSEWSKNDTYIARFMGKTVEVITGSYGQGLVTLALAESGFEKGKMSSYEVLSRCSDGYGQATHGGKIEMCFAAIGIQARQQIIEGWLPSAKRAAQSFFEKARAERAEYLYPNLEAFEVWMSLFSGNNEGSSTYIDGTTDAKKKFEISDRYRQMVKIKCLIAQNRLYEAMDTAMFLTGYYSSYDRHFCGMENELLKAIILYRLGNDQWKVKMYDTLKKAQEYHFVRFVSIEGCAVLPLLKIIKEEGLKDIHQEFFEQIYEESIRVAGFYPDYMRFIPKESISLTKRESQVFSMLCAGMAMDDICRELQISYDGLKKHNRNIYKKLGVKNRAEAERKAARIGWVYRG